MADRFLIGAGGTWDTAASDIWAAGSGGAADGGGIGAADAAILDANSGNLDVISNVVCGSFNTTGYGGTVDNTGTISVAGDLLIIDGTLTQNGAWSQIASGNIANDTVANRFGHIKLAMGVGVTSTLTDNVRANQVTIGPGTTTGAKIIYAYAEANGFWIQPTSAGALTVTSVYYVLDAGNYTVGRIDFSGVTNALLIRGETADRTLTPTADWVGGSVDLKIWNNTDTEAVKVPMGAYSLTCRDVLLGLTVGDKGGGQIDFGTGHHSFRNMNIQAGGDAAEDLVDFSSCNILLSGTIDCTGIDTLQNTGGVVVGGEVKDTDLTGQTALVHLYPSTAGTGNTNVTESSPPIGGAIPGRQPNPRRVRGR